ncbi:N-acetylglucosamine kinase-like BadF-type ATPase [Deinococcus metalli]|uniref:N-acetylglucosamine kinase n=1 Tax=Deinococcus metalli TaxID=1141878 RepID=A0A7W8KGB0_9DEIO|nr:BadF/BadG/BcrA/BcrD ATPase family protein [Deinococcus metalli]MBB5376471.1 N-acetylglucosamine kinase-like BadF-type ATPase [Deinococcus metalli]GHF43789.1 N-acetylglucosamine kinase [Deinococcus metalli]
MTPVADAVLGIDAGNTKTVALLIDPAGRVLGWGRAGPSNIYTGVSQALESLEHAVTAALDHAGLRGRLLRAAVLSASGADWPEDFALLRGAMAHRGWAAQMDVVNDAVGALRAGSVDGLGVAVVCGTSSGTAARAPGGPVWHSSFWQEPEGAEDLARQALRAVYRAHLGIDPPTTLRARALALFGVPDVAALMHRVTGRTQEPVLQPGRFARALLDEADAGDATSRRIAVRHGEALGDYALAAARQVGLHGGYRLVTTGGVMRHPSALLRGALVRQVQAGHPDVTWQAGALEPVCGAALLAAELHGPPVTAEQYATLAATTPHAGVFET